jgi:hypothetical protein
LQWRPITPSPTEICGCDTHYHPNILQRRYVTIEWQHKPVGFIVRHAWRSTDAVYGKYVGKILGNLITIAKLHKKEATQSQLWP